MLLMMKLFQVFVGAVLFLGLLCGTVSWPCTFTSGNQSYNFTSQSNCTDTTSSTCFSGMYKTTDHYNEDYYFKLCDPVITTPNANLGSTCKPSTQVCQEDGNNFDISCGVGPPEYSLISTTESQGVVQATNSGDICASTGTGRATTINLKCPPAFGRENNDIDPAVEVSTCVFHITLYINAACGTGSNILCCTYKGALSPFALCSTEDVCPPVRGYHFSSQKLVSDCSSCTPDVPSTLDCCLYQGFDGDLLGKCTSDGICPSENGYILISKYPTTDCDTCNPIPQEGSYQFN